MLAVSFSLQSPPQLFPQFPRAVTILAPKLILWSRESLLPQGLCAPCSAEGLGFLQCAVEPQGNLW